MSRPRNAIRPIVVPVKLTLVPGRDDDLITVLLSVARRQRAGMVISALRGAAPTAQGVRESDDDTSFLDDLAL